MFKGSFARYLFIQVSPTPNPRCLMLAIPVPHLLLPKASRSVEVRRQILPSGADHGSSSSSPRPTPSLLGSRILEAAEGVVGVMVSQQFVTIERDEVAPEEAWEAIRAATMAVLMDYVLSGEAERVVQRAIEVSAAKELNNGDDSAAAQDVVEGLIAHIVETIVRPLILRDGGDITVKGFSHDTGRLEVALHGACRKCPDRPNTLQASVERVLRHYVPEVTQIVDMSVGSR